MQLYKNLLITLYNINKDSKMYHYAAYCAVDCTTNHGYHCCDVTLDEIIDEGTDGIIAISGLRGCLVLLTSNSSANS